MGMYFSYVITAEKNFEVLLVMRSVNENIGFVQSSVRENIIH